MKKYYIIIIFFMMTAFVGNAQKMDTVLRMSVQAGAGWMHYYNNLIIGHDKVTNDYIGTSIRLMWEPEHRLSLGVETGYYKLYTVKLNPGDGNVSLSIVPVLANIRMRIVKNVYLTAGTGVVMMKSKVNSTPAESGESTVISYSNVQVSGLYLYHLTQQFAVGGEVKFMWLDKTDDFMHSVQAVISYRF